MRQRRRRRNDAISIAAVIFATSTTSIAWTIFVPLLAVNLERMGTSTFLIGVTASIWALPIVLLGPIYPRIILRFGAVTSLTIGMSISAVVLLIFPLFVNVYFWIALNIISGAAQGHFWILTEAWINQVASDSMRGRVMSLYKAVPAGAAMIAPIILIQIGFDGYLPYAICAFFILVGLGPLYLFKDIEPDVSRDPPPTMVRMLFGMAVLLVIALVAGVFEEGPIILLPIFAIESGLSEERAVALLTFFLSGGLILLYPIGWVADKFGYKPTLLTTSLIALACAVLLPYAIASYTAMIFLVFVWGAVAGAYYTLGLALMGSKYRSNALAPANTLFVIAHSLGIVVGPPAVGFAMDWWGAIGFVYAFGGAALMALVFGVAQINRGNKISQT